MTPAQDPFYIVKDEIQDSIDKVQDTFHQWKQTPENTGEYVHLTKELLTSCESIQWQVDELEKAISVAERDPAYYGLNEGEIGRRRSWTSLARNQVFSVRRNVEAGRQKILVGNSTNPSESIRSKKHISQDNDEFIASESDQQMLLIKRQDEELDALSASVQRIGGVGLTIHDELAGQEKLLGELSLDMETTSNRLDFVQSGNGDEEGQLEGADHDDCVPSDSFHHSFRSGVFDLRYWHELCVILCHVEFRISAIHTKCTQYIRTCL
ncbi:unnamed protein product [Urochloa decumbens]|uniref:t-SNARE coiled-coil homology domain-containing protein n=1 Tax=Urochloa decumbens TaxID=240449 RepID=A0ABC9ARY2_9POAL